MAQLEMICWHPPEFRTQSEFNQLKVQLAANASALVDRGRIFFENVPWANPSDQADDPRGQRPKVLDEVVVAYLVACDLSYQDAARNLFRRDELGAARRVFVSYLRAAIGDAREMNCEVDAARAGRSVKLNAYPPTPGPLTPSRKSKVQ